MDRVVVVVVVYVHIGGGGKHQVHHQPASHLSIWPCLNLCRFVCLRVCLSNVDFPLSSWLARLGWPFSSLFYVCTQKKSKGGKKQEVAGTILQSPE